MNFPLELIFKICVYVDSKSLYNFCTTCWDIYYCIWENSSFWNKKCLVNYGKISFKHNLPPQRLYFTFQQVISFGGNTYGELGVGNTDKQQSFQFLGIRAKKVFAGKSCSFAIDHKYNIWVWGRNNNGQLGTPDLETGTELFFKSFCRSVGIISTDVIDKPYKLGFRAKDISIGDFHTFFHRLDNSIWTCGINSDGQMGLKYIKHSRTPRFVAHNVKKFAVGGYHSLYIDTNEKLWVFGNNEYWQLGVRGNGCKIIPKYSRKKAKSIGAGLAHTVMVGKTDNVWVTGCNDCGQLGIIGIPYVTRPIQLGIKAKYVAAAANHTLAIDLDNYVVVWGDNRYGQLGTGDNISYDHPKKLTIQAKYISTGRKHSLLTDLNNNIWVCGSNKYGQLGLNIVGTNVWTNIPYLVVNSIAAGDKHSLIAATQIV